MPYLQSVSHSEKFAVPAASVWNLLIDWAGLINWMPQTYVRSLAIEGEGEGAIRHLVTGQGVSISERLDAADKERGLLCLSIIDPLPWNMLSYSAEAQLDDLDECSCRLTWCGTFELTESGSAAEKLAGLLNKSYIKMFEGIRAQLTGENNCE